VNTAVGNSYSNSLTSLRLWGATQELVTILPSVAQFHFKPSTIALPKLFTPFPAAQAISRARANAKLIHDLLQGLTTSVEILQFQTKKIVISLGLQGFHRHHLDPSKLVIQAEQKHHHRQKKTSRRVFCFGSITFSQPLSSISFSTIITDLKPFESKPFGVRLPQTLHLLFRELASTQLHHLNLLLISIQKFAMARAELYQDLPKRIFGLRCSQHRVFKIRDVLSHYKKRFRRRATKDRLLRLLANLEGEVSNAEQEAIHEWLSVESSEYPLLVRLLYTAQSEEEKQAVDGFSEDESVDEDVNPQFDCCVCMNSSYIEDFPEQKITELCNHSPTVCRRCLIQSIDSQIPDVSWDQVRCPECPEPLPYTVVKIWASQEVFERYGQKMIIRENL